MITAKTITRLPWTDLDPRIEWPMDFYISAWRLFRSLSDENQLTAKHLLSRPRWPAVDKLKIVDFGCGDGMLLENLLLTSPITIDSVHLVDPDAELLEQARLRLQELKSLKNLETTLARAEDVVETVTRDASAALAVHLVYLLNDGQLQNLLRGMKANVPLYIIMDKETSVFTKLWEKTAPKYHSRLLGAHKAIQSLDRNNFVSVRTDFTTHLSDPMTLRTEVRDFVFSLLCYANFKQLETAVQNWVQDVLRDVTDLNAVPCDCVCYELISV